MKRRIYLNEDGIPTVESEEGVFLVDEEGVIQFKRKGSFDMAVETGSFSDESQKVSVSRSLGERFQLANGSS